MNGVSMKHLLTELVKDSVCGGNTHIMFGFIGYIPALILLGIVIVFDIKGRI